MKNFIGYLIVIGLLIATTAISEAKIPIPINPFTNGLYVQENCPNGGLTTLKLRISSHKMGKTPISDGLYAKGVINGSIHFSDNINYVGDTLFDFDLTEDTVVDRFITVDIPKNDTSWVMFRIVNSFRDFQYFVTTKDTLELYDDDPQYKLKMLQGGPGAYKYYPELFPQPDTTTYNPNPDFTGSKMGHRILSQEELELDRMKRLEEEPLVGHDAQDMLIGGQMYRRYEGESKFHKIEPIKEDTRTFEERIQAAEDSVNAIPKDSLFRACLRIDTKEQLEIAKNYFGSGLLETNNPRYYHVVSIRDSLIDIYKNKGVVLDFTKDFNHVHPDSTGERMQPIKTFPQSDSTTSSKKNSKKQKH